MRISHFICILCIAVSSLGQTSGEAMLHARNQKIDTNYIKALNEYAHQLLLKNPAESLPYINRALELSDSLNYLDGRFESILNKGGVYWSIGLPDLALKYYLQAENLLNGKRGIQRAALYNNIGEVFKKKKQFDSSILYYRKGLASVEDQKPVILLYNIGEAYLLLNTIDSARKYFDSTYQNAMTTNHQRGLAYALSGKAELELNWNNPKEAKGLFANALNIRRKIADVRGVIQSHYHLAECYQLLEQKDSVLHHIDAGIQASEGSKAADLLAEGYRLRSLYYAKINEHKSAFEWIKRHYELRDSLSNVVFIESIDQIKNALTKELQNAENQALIEQRERQNTETQMQIVLIAAACLFAVLLSLYVYQTRQRKAAIKSTQTNRKMIEALQSVSKLWTSEGFEAFLKDVLKIASDALNVSRVSFWKYNPANNSVIVTNFYTTEEGGDDLMGHEVLVDNFTRYFQYLYKENIIASDDTSKESKLVEFDREYLRKNKIKSLMDVEVRSEDNFIGILSFEHTETTRNWSLSDKRFASSLGNIISSAYFLEQNRQLLMKLFSKNQQLRDSASMLSHDLREPLAQILGFSDLQIKNQSDSLSSWEYVDKAAKQMDNVIRELTKQMHRQAPEE